MNRILSYALHYMCRPAALAASPFVDAWYLYLASPALCTMLFFLQIGLDKLAVDFTSGVQVFAFASVGLVSGVIFAMLIAALVWGGVWLFHRDTFSVGLYFRIVPCVCAVFALPAAVMVFGLLFHLLFHWSTGLSFGLTAMLCIPVFLIDLFRGFWKDRVWMTTAAVAVTGILLVGYLHIVMLII